jgi:hypothetical protein
MKLLLRTVRNFADSFFVLQSSVPIPKGKIPKYRAFWSDLLTRLEMTEKWQGKKNKIFNGPERCTSMENKIGNYKREIVSSKKQTYQNFFKNLDHVDETPQKFTNSSRPSITNVI